MVGQLGGDGQKMTSSIATLLTDLAGISYGVSGSTTVQVFRHHDDDLTDFTTFPLILIEDGEENVETGGNKVTTTFFHPKVHLFVEADTAANLAAYRDSMRNAIYENATLQTDTIDISVDGIVPSESESRKLQHLEFSLPLTIDKAH